MSQMYVNGQTDEDVREYGTLDTTIQKLLHAALGARDRAYCPYSNFAVGAAILTADGNIFTGCNIENDTHSAGICAERTAAIKAITEGKRDLIACAVVAQPKGEGEFMVPCGVCRQFLSEFATNRDISIYVIRPTNTPLRVLCTSIWKLLPRSVQQPKRLVTNFDLLKGLED